MTNGNLALDNVLFWEPKFWEAQETNRGFLIPGSPFARWEIRDQDMVSGFVGYFGGINPRIVDYDLGSANLEQILLKFAKFAVSQNLRAIEMRMPPLGYYPRFDNQIYKALAKLNWTESQDEIFSFINRDAELNRVLRKNRKYDVAWWEKQETEYLSGLEFLADAHKVIAQNFEEKSRQNLIGLEPILKLSTHIPDHVNAHLLTASNMILAAAITLEIDKSLTHIFKWANSPVSEKKFPSALPLLFKRIFENQSILNGGRICLGTSTDNAKINLGLLDFKTSLGFEMTSRKIMRKELTSNHE